MNGYMAVARLNVALQGLSGKFGDALCRQYGKITVVSPAQDYSLRKRNDNQKASSKRFGGISHQAAALMHDPLQKPGIERWARRARRKPRGYLMHYLMKEHKPGQPFPWDAPPPFKPAAQGNAEN